MLILICLNDLCSHYFIHLNYSILLVNNDDNKSALDHFRKFEEKWNQLSPEEKDEESEIEGRKQLLEKALGIEKK